MRHKSRYLAIIIFLLAGAGVLIWAALDSNWIKTMSVDEYLRNASSLRSAQVQIYGKIAAVAPANSPATFQITGAGGGTMQLKFDQAFPPNFRPGADVLVNCTADGNGALAVNNILTKCPSKYTSGKNK